MSPIYTKLSSLKFLSKSYSYKFLFIAFLGIHIPLIGLISYVVFKPHDFDKFTVLGITLLLTLAATGITLYILNGLLAPLHHSQTALQNYRFKRELPNLPVHYPDEAGRLMQNIQFTISELNDLFEEKKDLTGLLSHDLRIPLRNVKTFSKMLLKNDDDEVKEVAGMIYESAQEQTNLLENILEILRQDHLFFQESQNIAIVPEKIITDVIASFEGVAGEKGIVLESKIDYSGTVNVHPELFTQVLKNLTSNAIKFSHPGSQVSFSVYKKEEKTFIDIKDNGIGFEPMIADRLFDRFTKNGRTGTSGEPSIGIGLYLSRKIMKHYKGDLHAFSEGADKGSVFSISLS